MKAKETRIVYENPLPQLRSRQSFFPWLAELPVKMSISRIVPPRGKARKNAARAEDILH